jgi:hypothetical protein
VQIAAKRTKLRECVRPLPSDAMLRHSTTLRQHFLDLAEGRQLTAKDILQLFNVANLCNGNHNYKIKAA